MLSREDLPAGTRVLIRAPGPHKGRHGTITSMEVHPRGHDIGYRVDLGDGDRPWPFGFDEIAVVEC